MIGMARCAKCRSRLLVPAGTVTEYLLCEECATTRVTTVVDLRDSRVEENEVVLEDTEPVEEPIRWRHTRV
jgi:hypothetical protein